MKRTMISTGRPDNPMLFQQCPSCKALWPTRAGFLADPDVRLVGYKAIFSDLPAGVLLFEHRCNGLVTIHAGEFADLYDGPIFSVPQTGGASCPGYCLHVEELRPCPAQCRCAFLREIVHLIHNWPKHAGIDRATVRLAEFS